MGLFDKLREPVFYKESSDAKAQLEHLKDFYKNAPDDVKKQVEKDIKLLHYGISGEESIAFELMNSFMPIIILHDLYFEYEGLSAQIDYLVITRKVIIVIESKNLVGDIEVTKDGDFIRTIVYGSKKHREGIYSPITQNQRHLDLLRKIRRDQKSNIFSKALFDKYFNDSYKSIVVLANPKAIINMKYAKKEVKDKIIRCDQLVEYIRKLNKASSNPQSSDKEMYEIADRFLNLHTSNTKDYTKKYGVAVLETKNTVKNDVAVTIEEKAPKSTENLQDTPIYQALKQFRYDRSKEENVKAYFIYNNSQMEDLINLMPKSLDEIKSISGFGDVKCNKYGKVILEIINTYR